MAKTPTKEIVDETSKAEVIIRTGDEHAVIETTTNKNSELANDLNEQNEPAEPAQWANIRITHSPYTTRRRAGFEFTREPTRLDLNHLSDAQLDAISHDNCLEIKLETDVTEPDA